MSKKKKKVQHAALNTQKVETQKSPVVPVLFWIILGAGLLIRLTYLWASRKSPFYEPVILDPNYYHEWARGIVLRGQVSPYPVFYGLPLYPFFIALCYKIFSGSLFFVKLVQSVLLGSLTLYLSFRIGDRMAGRSVGLLAAFLGAFYGPLFFHEQILIPETLAVPLYALTLWYSILLAEKITPIRTVLLGVFAALAALTKAGVVPFLFLYVSYLKFRKRSLSWKGVSVIFISFFAVLSPVTTYNVIHGKDFVLLTSHGGYNFYVGNNPSAEGVFKAPEGTGDTVEAGIIDSKAVAERAARRALKPSEVSRYWSNEAMRFIRENPGKFCRLFWDKVLLFFDGREISDVDDYAFSRRFVGMLRFPWIFFGILGPLAFAGLAASIYGGLRHRSIIYLWVFSYVFSVALFFINARYRLPLLSALFVLGAFGLRALFEDFRKGRWKRLLIEIAAFGCGLWVALLGLVGTSWAKNFLNAGDIYLKKGDIEAARALYAEAIEVEGDSYKALQSMGMLYTRLGEHEKAKEYYEKALALSPENSLVFNNLGLAYDKAGDLSRAERCFEKALALKPTSYQAMNNLGMIYGKRGDLDRAQKLFEEALGVNPKFPRAYLNLAMVLYKRGEIFRAREALQSALKADPEFDEARRMLARLSSSQ